MTQVTRWEEGCLYALMALINLNYHHKAAQDLVRMHVERGGEVEEGVEEGVSLDGGRGGGRGV